MLAIFLCIGMVCFLSFKFISLRKTITKAYPYHLGVVLGSGGHTHEMLAFLEDLLRIPGKFHPVTFFIAENDLLSESKLFSMLKMCQNDSLKLNVDYFIIKLARPRNVGQRDIFWIVCNFLKSFIAAFKPLIGVNVLLCNGPSLCIPIIYAYFLLTLFTRVKRKSVYIESIARVKTFSYSACFVYLFVDGFWVQWRDMLQSNMNFISKAKCLSEEE